jgi:hypothetical protein
MVGSSLYTGGHIKEQPLPGLQTVVLGQLPTSLWNSPEAQTCAPATQSYSVQARRPFPCMLKLEKQRGWTF